MFQKELLVESEPEMSNLAIKVASNLDCGSVIALNGDLGSGKTFFAKNIISFFCPTILHIISPTFNLLQTYTGPFCEIFHFDLYRLKSSEEIFELGIEDAFNNNICLIEWPGIISDFLPKDAINIELSLQDENRRLVSISSTINLML